MLSIRLQRVGRKKAPTYRVVVMPKTRDPYGKVVEILGHYNPRSNPKEIVLKEDRIKYWLSEGAQPTETVHNLFVDQKLIEAKKVGVSHISKKRKAKIAEKEAETKAKEEEAAAQAKEAQGTDETETQQAAKEETTTSEDDVKEEKAAEEKKEEESKTEEKPAEEQKEEGPAEEAQETPAEEKSE